MHHLVGLLAALQVQVAGEARLIAAQTIWHQLVAVTGHSVQRPLVHLRLGNETAQPVAGICHQVKEAPGRVVRPSYLEGAVPDPGVRPGLGKVVRGNPDAQEFEVITAPRDRCELRGIHPQGHQGTVGVAQLAFNDLGVGLQKRLVLQAGLRGVCRDAAQTNIPRTSASQGDVVTALVARGGLAGHRVGQNLHIPGSMRLHVDRVADRGAVEISIGRVLQRQGRNADLDAHGIDVWVVDRPHHRLAGLALDAYGHLVFYRRKAGDVALLLGAGSGFERDPLEVVAAIRVLDRGVVEVHRLQASGQTFDFPLANQIHHPGIGLGAQTVGGFLRNTGAAASTLAATACANDQSRLRGIHTAISSTSMPALITAEPTMRRPYPTGTG